MTQKIRGGRQILDDLKLIRDAVREAGRDNTDYPTNVRLTEDTGRDLLKTARALDHLIALLEPMLERIERRTTPREIEDHERRLIALESRITAIELERRGVRTLPERKERG